MKKQETQTPDKRDMFTGGDWFVKGRGTGNDPFWIESSAAPNVPIAEIMIPYGKKMAELKANAALIAEAPAMYKENKKLKQERVELLKTIYHEIDIHCFSETENVSMTIIRNVLVKHGANEPDLW